MTVAVVCEMPKKIGIELCSICTTRTHVREMFSGTRWMLHFEAIALLCLLRILLMRRVYMRWEVPLTNIPFRYVASGSGPFHNPFKTFSNLSRKMLAWAGVKMRAGLRRMAEDPHPPQLTPSLRSLVRIWSRLQIMYSSWDWYISPLSRHRREKEFRDEIEIETPVTPYTRSRLRSRFE